MKKFLALIMVMLMVTSLVACGGDTSASRSAVATYAEEQLIALNEVYNSAAILYNEIAVLADENGWMADELTAAEVVAVEETLGTIGTALIEDMSLLDGVTDFDLLIETIDSLIPELEGMLERVSKPYAAE